MNLAFENEHTQIRAELAKASSTADVEPLDESVEIVAEALVIRTNRLLGREGLAIPPSAEVSVSDPAELPVSVDELLSLCLELIESR